MQIESINVPPLQLQLSWQDHLLQSIQISPCKHKKLQTTLSAPAGKLAEQLLVYINKQPVCWPALPLAWDNLPGFSRQVLAYIHLELGWGEWLSYSRLAALCGRPQAARAVGRAMSRNPWPLIVPCHRVLGKDKKLGGFSSGLNLKKLLLSLERIL